MVQAALTTLPLYYFVFAGAVLGEYLSFAIGRHYQDRVRHWQIFIKHPDWLIKTDLFFERFGVASIALGRFVGPVRAFVPLIAGMSSMSVHRFQIINILSALVWAPMYLIPGVIVGASFQIDTSQSWLLVSTLIICAISSWLAAVYIRNLWFTKHPVDHPDYDQKFVGVKLMSAVVVLAIGLWILIWGPMKALFLQLLNLLYSIIFQL